MKSILDNDFYKFTMQQAVIKLFPRAKAKYAFINRGAHQFPEGFAGALREKIQDMAGLKLSAAEKTFLAQNCPYFDPTYLDFLQGYRYDPAEVQVEQEGSTLSVRLSGLWYRTIMWEVPVLSLICELYYSLNGLERMEDEQVSLNAAEKIRNYAKLGITIADFGTRRRHSYRVQQLVIAAMAGSARDTFIGTSNVHFAMQFQTKPIGTHAHEWFMFHAAKYGYKMSNELSLEHWTAIYRGDLGIALSDTYTSEIFFAQFDKKFSKLFDGVRHDSGDPIAFAKRTIEHYKAYGIDPLSKTIIFSDGLDYEKIERIASFCRGKIGMSFGVGTNFTNDVGPAPMNVVLKMTQTRPDEGEWTPVVKLSDERNKYTGTPEAITLAKQVLNIV